MVVPTKIAVEGIILGRSKLVINAKREISTKNPHKLENMYFAPLPKSTLYILMESFTAEKWVSLFPS